jgi:hypothetical protein
LFFSKTLGREWGARDAGKVRKWQVTVYEEANEASVGREMGGRWDRVILSTIMKEGWAQKGISA